MASSSYYYNLYAQKRSAVTIFENRIRELRKIHSNLTDNLYDEIRSINNEIDDLKNDLNQAVRHNSTFQSLANAFESFKEKSVTADSSLRSTSDELQEEIMRISNQKSQAIHDRDYYHNEYVAKKEEEEQAYWDSLMKGAGK